MHSQPRLSEPAPPPHAQLSGPGLSLSELLSALCKMGIKIILFTSKNYWVDSP